MQRFNNLLKPRMQQRLSARQYHMNTPFVPGSLTDRFNNLFCLQKPASLCITAASAMQTPQITLICQFKEQILQLRVFEKVIAVYGKLQTILKQIVTIHTDGILFPEGHFHIHFRNLGNNGPLTSCSPAICFRRHYTDNVQ